MCDHSHMAFSSWHYATVRSLGSTLSSSPSDLMRRLSQRGRCFPRLSSSFSCPLLFRDFSFLFLCLITYHIAPCTNVSCPHRTFDVSAWNRCRVGGLAHCAHFSLRKFVDTSRPCAGVLPAMLTFLNWVIGGVCFLVSPRWHLFSLIVVLFGLVVCSHYSSRYSGHAWAQSNMTASWCSPRPFHRLLR